MNTLYNGGPVTHPDPTELTVHIQWVKGLKPLSPDLDSSELLASYVANNLACVRPDDFANSPYFELFNACNRAVRLRAFTLLQELQGTVTAFFSETTPNVRADITRVLQYIESHEGELAINDLVDQLVLQEKAGIIEYEDALQAGDFSVTTDEMNMDIQVALAKALVVRAVAASITMDDLHNMYEVVCTKHQIAGMFSLDSFKAWSKA